MQTSMPDWALWRSFLAVIDRGSLLGAAKVLGCHQPTVSRQIAALEQQLGQPLFERGGRGLMPTALAQSLVEPARRMAANADELSRLVTGVRQEPRGTVRLTASQVVAGFVLPEVLIDLHRAEPQIAIELLTDNGIANLLRREADIAIRLARPLQTGLIARKLGELKISAYAHQDYLRGRAPIRSPEDLLQHDLLGLDRDPTLLKALAGAGLAVEPQSFWLRTDDQIAYTRLLMEGAGIGWMPSLLAARHGALTAVLPSLLSTTLPVWLVVHREIRGSLPVRRVFDFLARALLERLSAASVPADGVAGLASGRDAGASASAPVEHQAAPANSAARKPKPPQRGHKKRA